jgi:hypothetical protein
VVLILFIAFVAFASTVALVDWRRGFILACVVGVLQDPVRKLVPGQPVFLTFSIVGVYLLIIFAVQRKMQRSLRDFSRRFPAVWGAFGVLLLFLFIGAVNGIMTFGLEYWKAPLLSLFVYLAPLPAVLIGYIYLDNEERLYRFFRFYAVLTSVALIGSVLEYYRVNSPALGMVHQVGDYIRYLPGIQIRMLSGFYRAPDIMAWHAATLTSISLGLLLRAGITVRAWPWMLGIGWGFYNCMISGRRKAVYYVVAFVLVFLFRYVKRLKAAEIGAFVIALGVGAFVIHHIASNEESSVYTTAAVTSSDELGGRLEGGVIETIRQAGIMGAGLGVATQGVQHVLGTEAGVSWQEGGLGKLAVELGVPGLMAAALLVFLVIQSLLRISGLPDQQWSAQVGRITLFALILANIASFMASAQTYSDPVVTILSCFFVGCLFATVTLDERAVAAEMQQPVRRLSTVPA